MHSHPPSIYSQLAGQVFGLEDLKVSILKDVTLTLSFEFFKLVRSLKDFGGIPHSNKDTLRRSSTKSPEESFTHTVYALNVSRENNHIPSYGMIVNPLDPHMHTHTWLDIYTGTIHV